MKLIVQFIFCLLLGAATFGQSGGDSDPKVITGKASFYSKNLDGTETSTGEIFSNKKLTGASNEYPLNTWVRVTNVRNGKTVVVRINDRMHKKMAKKGRVIDLSRAAAKRLDFMGRGITKVKLEQVEKGTTE
ncbi:septal ring lytic transglycosylase RlpA family protein [Deminuibacter soli]|uniref:Probable endolytic peptidoglycan transglycosylase RlpA n=1 Tax=Deminuibacter soli TaxID=2291815 RepID=A0A3E1NLJ1_9BACT|nr:septal ring lytic transglycosylase RlpA family protein [Deminuibacter soli]RFM28761.1 septal ring lytic transglycosylase RlpA family protein [Deminuibacter soli]